MKKTHSQIQFEISHLLYLANSRFGTDPVEPSLEEQKKLYARIAELRNQIKDIKTK